MNDTPTAPAQAPAVVRMPEGPPRDVVLAYHARSKHHLQRFAAGPDTLDWDGQPDPFRRWPGATSLPLPLRADDCAVRWGALATPGAVPAQALNRSTLALLLELALGLAAWKTAGPDRWAVRCNPSSGNLHPTEGWVIAQGLPDLPDGVFHYAPRDHVLEQRASAAPGADSPGPPRAWLALSSVLWREAWKYGERAFRYAQLDTGHAVGALRYAAAVLGWRLRSVCVGSDELAALLGLDRDGDFGPAEREEPERLLQIDIAPPGLPPADEPAAPPRFDTLAWHGRPTRLDRHPMYRWPVIQAVAQASRPTAQRGDQAPAVTPPPEPSLAPPGTPSRPGPRDAEPAARLIRQRRSAQQFDRRARASLDQVLPLLAALQSRAMPLDIAPTPARVHVVVFAHRVDGLAPGAYLLPREASALPLLQAALTHLPDWARCTEVEDAARRSGAGALQLIRLAEHPALAGTLRTVNCHQALGSDAILAFSLLAEMDLPHAHDYRERLQEAGLLGHLLYLQAESAGLAGTGIGCYFDDALHQLLGLEDPRLQALYHFTVGVPLRDPRIGTQAPYAHLTDRSPEHPTMSDPHATPPPNLPLETAEPDPSGRPWQRLTPDEAEAFLQQHPDPLVLDARDEDRHAQGHLPGSLRLDGRNHERLLLREDRARPVLIYCDHGNASQIYAQMFADFGFAQVHDLVGGWTAWQASGRETSQGAASAPAIRGTPSAALAEFLAEAGFNAGQLQVAGPHGNTALMHAAWRGQLGHLDELLALGARVDATNADGNNALWLACVNGDAALVRRLVAAGVPLDHQNAVGATCLMYAASAGKPAVVDTLLALGADPHLTSQDDFTALDMAASLECLQRLRAATRRDRSAPAQDLST